MSTIAEAEKIVLNLPPRERGELAAKLLASLKPPYEDEEAIIAEALRRSDEMKNNPEMAISLEELDRRIRERFGWM
jgi:putative addiction module component (TIGR02574 family)